MSRREAVSVANARAAWGEALPAWVLVLAEACDKQSQAAVAKKVGRSAAAISAVLNNKYAGKVEAIECAVRGALMAEKVDCPVLGMIPTNECLNHQSRGFSTASPQTVKLARTCPNCRHANRG